MIGGLVTGRITADLLSRAISAGDTFALLRSDIPEPVRAKWRDLRAALVSWRDELKTSERKKSA